MKFSRLLNNSVMLFILLIGTTGAFAQQAIGQPPPPSSSGICMSGEYLYVLSDFSIHKYTASDLSLETSIELPRPALPESSDNQTQTAAGAPPEGMGPPTAAGSGMCTDGEYLFVLSGKTLQQYTIADMSLVQSVELPQPALQTTSN